MRFFTVLILFLIVQIKFFLGEKLAEEVAANVNGNKLDNAEQEGRKPDEHVQAEAAPARRSAQQRPAESNR